VGGQSVRPASRSWHSMCSSQGFANSADTWRGGGEGSCVSVCVCVVVGGGGRGGTRWGKEAT
jgi:hypothetical protein